MNRFMRMIILFDLPTLTYNDMVSYRRFRKFLIKNGFIMMQESIYSKLIINRNSLSLIKKRVVDNLPSNGNIQLLEITEKQFASIEYLCGKPQKRVIDSEKRVVEIWK